jgi:hypothetical protein
MARIFSISERFQPYLQAGLAIDPIIESSMDWDTPYSMRPKIGFGMRRQLMESTEHSRLLDISGFGSNKLPRPRRRFWQR